MRYHFFYQSKDNKSLDDWIVAKDRNDAYTQLRKRGIKPYKLLGRNPIAWKRWAAIGVLSASVAVLAWMLIEEKTETQDDTEPRAQLYGDPAIIQQLASNGWRDTFSLGDAWFARHAIPAGECDCPTDSPHLDAKHLAIPDGASPELGRMIKVINGMKDEYAVFLAAGGSQEDYMTLCDERLAEERDIVAKYNAKFRNLRTKGTSISAEWANHNAVLRSMGLPTVTMPEGED